MSEREPNQDFTLYWRDGKSEHVRGRDIAHAMNRAGYGGGAVRALDFYGRGKEPTYAWIGGAWLPKAAPQATEAQQEQRT